MKFFTIISNVLIAFFFVNGHAGAGVMSYTLKNTKCSFQLRDWKGGIIGDVAGQEFSWFSRKPLPKGGELSFSFTCIAPVNHDYCFRNWVNPSQETDRSTLKLKKIRRYMNFHPNYESLAFASNALAVAPPPPRAVWFCINNNEVGVTGLVWVGTDNNNETDAALKILKTIVIN